MPQSEQERLEQAAVVAHQLKSPLATLQTIVRTLLGGYVGDVPEGQKKLLASADRKCSEVMDTISGLLALSEASRHAPYGAAADLVRAVRRACERFREAAASKGVDLAADVDVESAFVRTRQAPLDEAVVALVDNAVKYTPADGRVVAELAVLPDTEEVRLTVDDSGIGFPEGETGDLFQPFFRATNAKQVEPKGTGLGLAFVRAVARQAGGRVEAGKSELGGARVVLTVPTVAACPVNGAALAGASPEPSIRVVVIGGVAAGPKIASKVKRLDSSADVTVVERGRVLSYAGCGLPYYISGMVRQQQDLVSTSEGVLRGADFFEQVKNVRIMDRTEAVRVDRESKRVLVRDLISSEERWLRYDKLAIATGALPVVPSIPGIDLQNVYTLHGIEHAEGIKARLAEGRAKDVTIVGGGLIGVETTEALVAAGCRVTLVEMQPQLLPILDWEMAELVRQHLESHGVRVMLNTRVTGFRGDGAVEQVLTEKGDFPAELVIMGVGVRPNVSLAREMGLEIGPSGAIRVDDHMRTSDPDIYAAGDCVEVSDLITGKPAYVPLGSTANKQGRVAAVNICGGDDRFPGVVGTTLCKVFDYTVARAGLTELRAREAGYDVVTSLTPSTDRAHFMPHAEMIVIKLVADRATRKLLGIQVVGAGEAAKRLDVAVTAITAGMTVDAVANLDLGYAPSYADALDSLHTACNGTRNKLDGLMDGIMPAEVRRRLDAGEDFVLLDVRTHTEFDASRIPGSRHIPVGALQGRRSELPDTEIVVVSRVGLTAYEAAVKLRAWGFERVRVMDGGMVMWPGDGDL